MGLKEVLNGKFVYVSEVAEILEIGFLTKKNVFLYGRGGHAKSEIINEFLKYIDPTGKDCFVQACGEGLTEDKLFGGIDMKKFQDTGEIKHLVENSFMNKKYVVFEELLDSRMNVLLSLKDIITAGMFRQGKQQFKIKTEFIVCLTNRTKQEVSEDNSIKALLERFPLEMKVEWPRYDMEDYKSMFNKVLHNSYQEVANICHCINETGDFVSPRTAIHMAQVYATTKNLSDLKFFGASTEVIEKLNKIKRDEEQMKLLTVFAAKLESITGATDECDIDDMKASIKLIKGVLETAAGHTYSDKIYKDYAELKKNGEEWTKKLKDNIIKTVMDE